MIGYLIEYLATRLGLQVSVVQVSLTSDSSGQVQVLLHDCGSVGVDGAKVGVLEDTYKVCFGGFLEGEEGLRLESEVGIDVGGDASDESLEGSSG